MVVQAVEILVRLKDIRDIVIVKSILGSVTKQRRIFLHFSLLIEGA